MGCSVSLLSQNLSTSVVLSNSKNHDEYDLDREALSNNYLMHGSTMKRKIKTRFFDKNPETHQAFKPSSETSIRINGKRASRRHYSSKSKRNVKLNASHQLGSCHGLEYDRSFSNDLKHFERTIATSLSKLSIQHHEQEMSSHLTTSTFSSSVHCTDSTKEFSVVYISDLNSNSQSTGSTSQENVYHSSGLLRKELPTSCLMQNCDAVAQHNHKDALRLESEDIAVAVHQGFFNEFGDICDDELIFSG